MHELGSGQNFIPTDIILSIPDITRLHNIIKNFYIYIMFYQQAKDLIELYFFNLFLALVL